MQYGDVARTLNLADTVLLDRKCEARALASISLKFSWRRAAPFLGLSPQQVEDILVDGHREQERRYLALNTWQEISGDRATYGRLMQALIHAKLVDQARNVLVVLLRSCRSASSSSAASSKCVSLLLLRES